MRSIVIAHLDKARPALILSRPRLGGQMPTVTIAPITSTVRGLSSEVPLGPRNGLDHECVASCDSITTIRAGAIGDTIGVLFDDQEADLAQALSDAFGLDLTRS
ncbi:MAG: type II toxin-antitoxin system PemK/MazF family toxin [Bifidobacteriaceae bacterium]|jgi:mRNA interferase MazF|nr:type II toxin-antitoxin system PemK/MazF family toxin [Bifidobacteriaceae bacterium]